MKEKRNAKNSSIFVRSKILIMSVLALCHCAYADDTSKPQNVLVLPSDLKTIEEEAFYGNRDISEVVLPDGIITIEKNAFADSSLSSINLPSSLQTIDDSAFDGPDKVSVAVDEDTYAYEWADRNGYIPSPFALPIDLTLASDGTVSFTVTEELPHTVMLAVYGSHAVSISSYDAENDIMAASVRMYGSGDVILHDADEDIRAASEDMEFLAVLPIAMNGQTSFSTNISSLFDSTGNYYVMAKSVASPEDKNARNFNTGKIVSSNTIYYKRPERTLDTPVGVSWSSVYSRAVWDEVPGAEAYQVMLYSGDSIVASRNVNTTWFDFSSGWIDFQNVTLNQYTFTVTALSSDTTAVSNSLESDHSGFLREPDETDKVKIITQPGDKYASLDVPATVSLSASGVGLTYEWYLDGEKAGQEDDASIHVPTGETGIVSIYCIVRDAFGTEVTSSVATVTVIDDNPVAHVITSQPESLQVDPDSRVYDFHVSVAYEEPYQIEYMWERNMGNGWETISSRSRISALARAEYDGYEYRCKVTVTSPTGRLMCEETSDTAVLNINEYPVFIQDNLDNEYWTAVTDYVDITATGIGELSYQWYADGVVCEGATAACFDIRNIMQDAEIYCIVSNGTDTAETIHAMVHPGDNPASGILLHKNFGPGEEHLAIGDEIGLAAYLIPDKSTSAVTWSSSDISVATVRGGSVRIVGLGSAIITAEANGHTASYEVTADSYLIEYNPMGGRFADGVADTKKSRITVGAEIPLPVIAKEGDTFLGWTLDGENVLTAITADNRMTLVAKWKLATVEEDKTLVISQDIVAAPQYAKIGREPALFEVVTNGAKVMNYQWYVNDGNGWTDYDSGVLNGSSKTRLEVYATEENNGWQFKVLITAFRDGTVVESGVGTLVTGHVDDPEELEQSFSFTRQPVSQTRYQGEIVEFSAAVNRDEASFQWMKDGMIIEGETNSSLILDRVEVSDAGKYSCIVTVDGDSRSSSVAVLTVIPRFTVTYDAGAGVFPDTGKNTYEDQVLAGSDGNAEYSICSEVPAWDNHTFNGWTLDGEPVSTVTLQSDICLVASWTEKNAMMITTDFEEKMEVSECEQVSLWVSVRDYESVSDTTYRFFQISPEGEEAEVYSTNWGSSAAYTFRADTSMNGNKYYCIVSCADQEARTKTTTLVVNEYTEKPDTVLISADQTEFTVDMSMMSFENLSITCTVEGISDLNDLVYIWEESSDGQNWYQTASFGDMQDTFITEMNMPGTRYFQVWVNGVKSNEIYTYTQEDMNGMCTCGCGMPGCTCGVDCPMMTVP